MPNHKGLAWQYFKEKSVDNKVVYSCKFCEQAYRKNATRMTLHLKKCSRFPTNLKATFSKPNKCSKSKGKI